MISDAASTIDATYLRTSKEAYHPSTRILAHDTLMIKFLYNHEE
jgi:hypothetical protein